MPTYGDPDGHGRYGILDLTEDGRLICHECGATALALGRHAVAHHDLTADQYREKYGLAAVPLNAPSVTEKLQATWQRHSAANLARLEQTRDIHAAREKACIKGRKRRAGTIHARVGTYRETVAERRATPRLTVETIARLQTLSVAEWVRAVDALRAQGVTVREIAEATGMREQTAYQRLHRHKNR